MDIRTLAIVLGITNLLQVIAIFLQYRVNKTFRGIGWWALGFASVGLGFVLLILRDVVSIALISIIAGNILIVLGSLFLYIGTMQFLDRKENRRIVISIFAVFLLSFCYYILVRNDITARTVIASAALAFISFLTAQGLFVHKTRMIAASANFISAIFIVHGCYFTVRAVATLMVFPIGSFFTPTLFQVTAFMDSLIIGIMLTFGFIIMVNQRLNAESREAREHFELIFNTSPDASLITRLTDGVIVNINDGFTALTGFTHDETVGKSVMDINIWKDPANRQKVVDDLREKGFCENFEAIFQRKDGSAIIGMMSAKMLTLQGAPHIVSVTHDITDRKQVEAALKESEEKFRLLAASAHDAIITMDHKENVFFWNEAAEKMFGHTNQEAVGKNCHRLIVPSRYHEAYEKGFGIFKHSGRGAAIGNTLELEARKKDGTEFPVELSLSSMRFNGEWSAVGIIRDITDRKRMEKELQDSENRYHELSIVDDLSQLFNSRHFYFQLKIELDRSNRYEQPLTLLLLDLDNFKTFNDAYGHVEGDQVLRRLGQVVKRCLRETDFAFRYGGEEFTILLPMTTSADGAVTAERIRTEFKKENFSPVPSQGVHLTVSIGLAQYKPQEELKAFVHRVDQFMYQGKKNGKDRVCHEP